LIILCWQVVAVSFLFWHRELVFLAIWEVIHAVIGSSWILRDLPSLHAFQIFFVAQLLSYGESIIQAIVSDLLNLLHDLFLQRRDCLEYYTALVMVLSWSRAFTLGWPAEERAVTRRLVVPLSLLGYLRGLLGLRQLAELLIDTLIRVWNL